MQPNQPNENQPSANSGPVIQPVNNDIKPFETVAAAPQPQSDPVPAPPAPANPAQTFPQPTVGGFENPTPPPPSRSTSSTLSGGETVFHDVSATGNNDDHEYISNPFLNVIRGLVLTLRYNPVSSLLAGLTGLLIIVGGSILLTFISIAVHSAAIIILISLIYVLIYVLPVGAYYVIAGNSGKREKVSTKAAYSQSIRKLLPFIGLDILTSLMLIVGFLLLIIPGFILLARCSLAPLVMFEEDLGPIKALKRSFSLTKGHVNEMLGALFAGMFMGGTYSLLFGAISVSPLVSRYNDLSRLQKSGQQKPATHWLNYSYLIAVVLVIAFVFGIIVLGKDFSDNAFSKDTTTSGQSQLNGDSTYQFPSDSSSSNDSSSSGSFNYSTN